MPATISKSKYLAGLQCPKLLWHHLKAPDLIPPPDPALQAIFDTGHAVGDLAKQLFPDGVEVPWSGTGATAAPTSWRRPLMAPGTCTRSRAGPRSRTSTSRTSRSRPRSSNSRAWSWTGWR